MNYRTTYESYFPDARLNRILVKKKGAFLFLLNIKDKENFKKILKDFLLFLKFHFQFSNFINLLKGESIVYSVYIR